jgi:RHS repeat-associated protein
MTLVATDSIAPPYSVKRQPLTTRRARGRTDGKGTTFVHDGRQKLMKASKTDGTTLDYAYNADGLRVERVKNATGTNYAGMPTGGTRTRYLLLGSEEIADLDSGRNIIRRYIPGAAIDERVAQVDANGAVTFIHNDKQNSVIALSDTTGNPVVRRGYGVYGETDAAQMTVAGPGTTPHPFGYTGRRWDADLGLYYYRARWYDPALGTFQQTDPIGSLDYINLYAYVGLEPGNGTDPTGMCRAVMFNGCQVTAKTAGVPASGIPQIRPSDFRGINGHAITGDGTPRQVDFRTVDLSDLGGSIQNLAGEKGSSLANAIKQAAVSGRSVPITISGLNSGGGIGGNTSIAQQGGIGRFAVDVSGQVRVNANGGWVLRGTVTGIVDRQDYPASNSNALRS